MYSDKIRDLELDICYMEALKENNNMFNLLFIETVLWGGGDF